MGVRARSFTPASMRPALPSSRLRSAARVGLAGVFVVAGVAHFVRPRGFEAIVPPPIPARPAVLASGVFEVLGGVGLLIPQTRRAAAWGLAALAIAVFPANVYAALRPETMPWAPVWALWARLPMQPVLVAAVAWAGGLRRERRG